ncbi:MAG: hypothetical protein V9E93_16650 [Steroidobacteraceae bacterium]
MNQKVAPWPGSVSTPIVPSRLVDHPAEQGEADADPAVTAIRAGVELLERLEDQVDLVGREPGAVVGDPYAQLGRCARSRGLDPGADLDRARSPNFTALSTSACVAHVTRSGSIHTGSLSAVSASSSRPWPAASRRQRSITGSNRADGVTGTAAASTRPRSRSARSSSASNRRCSSGGRVLGGVQVLGLGRRQVLGADQLEHADDARQWGADLVAEVGEERGLRAVGRLGDELRPAQLGGALLHPCVELPRSATRRPRGALDAQQQVAQVMCRLRGDAQVLFVEHGRGSGGTGRGRRARCPGGPSR